MFCFGTKGSSGLFCSIYGCRALRWLLDVIWYYFFLLCMLSCSLMILHTNGALFIHYFFKAQFFFYSLHWKSLLSVWLVQRRRCCIGKRCWNISAILWLLMFSTATVSLGPAVCLMLMKGNICFHWMNLLCFQYCWVIPIYKWMSLVSYVCICSFTFYITLFYIQHFLHYRG